MLKIADFMRWRVRRRQSRAARRSSILQA